MKRVAPILFRLRLGWLLTIACWPTLSGQALRAQDMPAKPAVYQGITRCLDCHYAPNPLRSTDFVFMNEGKIWLENDKHAIAYQQLGSEWGKRIAAKLGIEDAQAERACLSCHANWQSEYDQPPRSFEHGVHCEACHGPSSQWEVSHADTTWRQLSPKSKQELGMHDLRSPSVGSRVCFSCHIGDKDQGKFVTHAMYAAGHPPLSSFEIGSFRKQMPSHWRSFQEKPKFKHRAEFARLNGIIDEENENLPETKAVVVGGIVAFRESVRLIANQLQQNETGRIEFAVFDCSACHHELRTKSWRQQRGRIANRPGRPLPAIWPETLVRVALHHVARDDEPLFQSLNDEFEVLRNELLVAAASRPFGDREQVSVSASRIVPWLDEIVSRVENDVVARKDGQRILRSMFQKTQEDLLDFESARMLSWAMITTATELSAPYPSFDNDVRRFTHSQWLEDVRLPAENLVKDRWKNAGLFSDLSLQLPSRPERTIEVDMSHRAAAAMRYDAVRFRTRVLKLENQFETSTPAREVLPR